MPAYLPKDGSSQSGIMAFVFYLFFTSKILQGKFNINAL